MGPGSLTPISTEVAPSDVLCPRGRFCLRQGYYLVYFITVKEKQSENCRVGRGAGAVRAGACRPAIPLYPECPGLDAAA